MTVLPPYEIPPGDADLWRCGRRLEDRPCIVCGDEVPMSRDVSQTCSGHCARVAYHRAWRSKNRDKVRESAREHRERVKAHPEIYGRRKRP